MGVCAQVDYLNIRQKKDEEKLVVEDGVLKPIDGVCGSFVVIVDENQGAVFVVNHIDTRPLVLCNMQHATFSRSRENQSNFPIRQLFQSSVVAAVVHWRITKIGDRK